MSTYIHAISYMYHQQGRWSVWLGCSGHLLALGLRLRFGRLTGLLVFDRLGFLAWYLCLFGRGTFGTFFGFHIWVLGTFGRLLTPVLLVLDSSRTTIKLQIFGKQPPKVGHDIWGINPMTQKFSCITYTDSWYRIECQVQHCSPLKRLACSVPPKGSG